MERRDQADHQTAEFSINVLGERWMGSRHRRHYPALEWERVVAGEQPHQ
jgi:hypothetical protein